MTQSAVSRASTMLRRRDEEEDDDSNNPGIFAMSIRIPSNVASLLSSMAHQAGCSRNEMANLIVEAGIDAILASTAPDSVAQIHEHAEFHVEDFIS